MKVEIIKECPSCGSNLERVKDQLYCRSDNCSGANKGKILSFAKVAKIKGLGEKTIDKLGILTIEDIFNLDYKECSASIGEKLTDKLFEEIEKASTLPLDQFLASMSIPLIGASSAKKIAKIVDSLDEINERTCREAGLGKVSSTNLLYFIDTYEELPIKITSVKSTQEITLKVCVTGKIPGYTRNTIAEYLESLGVATVSAMSSKLDYVITDNINGNSSKLVKARELNIPIITLKQLEESLNV